MSDPITGQHVELLVSQIRALEDRMINPREFGHLEQQVKDLASRMETMEATLESINTTLTEARGGWKTLMLFGGAGAVGGQLVAWAVQWLKHLP